MNKALKIRIIEIFNTQADFAQALGRDESYVSRIIRGRRHLDSANKKRWAKLLRCDSKTIFGKENRE